MFSPNVRIYNQAKENGGSVARKPDLSNTGTKKPLGDRPVNETRSEKKPLKQLRPKQQTESEVIPEKLPTPSYPDWLSDTCTYKSMEDVYEDTLSKENQIIKDSVAGILQRFTSYYQPKTPPPKFHVEIDKMFLELPRDDSGFSFHDDCFTIPPDETDADIPMPTIDFNDFAF